MIRTTALLLTLSVAALASTRVSAETFESDGVEIYYTVQGSGEPVVLIHGFTGSATTNFGNYGVIDALAETYQVIAIDNRGHGASEKPHDPAAYGDQMLADVINLLDHLEIERANFVGYSMGGMITQTLAMRHPERVIKAAIGGAGGVGGSDVAWLEPLIASLESGNGIGPLLVALTPPGQPMPTPEQIAATDEQLLATNDPLALAAVARGFPELNDVTEAELRANKTPLLYLVGDLDPLRAGVDGIKTIVGNADFKTVPGADHMTAFVSPMFLQSISDFLGAN